MWRRSPQKHLARAAGVSPRSVEYWGDSRGLSADALANLIRSDEGLYFLEAVMADSPPRWWRVVRAFLDVAEAQRLQAAAQKRISRAVRGAIEANDELEQNITRGTAALAFHDQDFVGSHLAAEREFYRAGAAGGGVPNRAVARSAKGRD